MNRLALLMAAIARASADCYYPDGSPATNYNYQPCGTANTTYSTCCYFGEGDICLANGLCNWPGVFDYRAACQNADWSNCPEICLDESPSSWKKAVKCGENAYCCSSSDCCSNGSEVVTLSVPDSVLPSTTTDESSSTTTTQDRSDTTETSTDESSSTTRDGPATTLTTADVTVEVDGSGSSVIRTTIIVTTTADGTEEGESGGGSSTPVGAIVGGVVGGVLVLGLIAVGIWYFIRTRSKQPSAAPAPTMATAGGGAAGYYGGGGNTGMQQPQQFQQQQQPFVQPNMATQYNQQYQMPQTMGGGMAKPEGGPMVFEAPAVQQRHQGSGVVELA